jgi:hypothetical protein
MIAANEKAPVCTEAFKMVGRFGIHPSEWQALLLLNPILTPEHAFPAPQHKKKPGLLRASSLPTVVVPIVAAIVSRAIIVIRIRSATIVAVSRAIVVTVVVGIGCRCRA